MKSIFRFFVERHLLATLFTIMVLFIGIFSASTIKRELFPKVEIEGLYISTVYPGASPEDVELNVTNKIENQLKSLNGIKEYTSVSMEDISLVIVIIDPDLSKKKSSEVKDNIKTVLGRIKNLPKETEPPLISKMTTSDIPIIDIGIYSEKLSYETLRDKAKIFEKKLKKIEGVAKIETYGIRDREVRIELNQDKMKKYLIPVDEIIHAISARNIRGSEGTLESYTGEKTIATLAQFKTPKEVGEVIVRTSFDGPSIKVKDLAKIKNSYKKDKTISRMNGKEVISFSIYKKEKADIIRTVNRIKDFLNEKKNIPADVQIVKSNDYSRFVQASFDVVKSNGIMGIILVFVILAMFLSLKTSFWVALGIPVSLLGTIAVLPLFGIYLDVITLSAMILVLGILVDDAIVVSESVERRFELGDDPENAAVNGINIVFKPVVITVLTTILAFTPMFFLPGDLGKFVIVIPAVIILTLLLSLFEVSFALPAHIAQGLKKKKKKVKAGFFDKIQNIYEKIMQYVLKLRYLLVTAFVLVLLSSIWYAKNNMEIIVFPSEGAEEFSIFVKTPIGANLERTSDRLKEIEEVLNTVSKDEISSYTSIIGSHGDIIEQSNLAYIRINLTPFSTRERNANQIVEELNEKTKKLKGFSEVIYDVKDSGPSSSKPIEIRILGGKEEARNKLTNDVFKSLEEIEGVFNVTRDDKTGKEVIEIKLNYEKLAKLGLTVADISNNVRIAYDGETVTKVQYGDEEVYFRIIMPEKIKMDKQYLKNLLIPNNTGRLIPLKKVAKLVKRKGSAAKIHFNSERSILVQANIQKNTVTPGEVLSKVMSKYENSENFEEDYPGCNFVIEGDVKQKEESLQGFLKAFLIALLGIYFLLVILFNSFFQPLLVIVAVPFGLVGVIIVFAIPGEPLSFMAMLGIIGLSGVVVNDSLVLVDHLNNLLKNRKDNISPQELIAKGTANRLRAIFLTTITTSAGLLPLAYGIGGVDPTNAPMALSLGWGLLFATPLTLMLIPSLYAIMEDFKKIFKLGAGKPVLKDKKS